jgi:hypothetical protein
VSHTYEKGGIVGLLSIMPYTGFYYFGLDIIPIVCDEVKNASNSSLINVLSLSLSLSCLFLLFSLFLSLLHLLLQAKAVVPQSIVSLF